MLVQPAGGGLSQGLLQPHHGDYFTAGGPSNSSASTAHPPSLLYEAVGTALALGGAGGGSTTSPSSSPYPPIPTFPLGTSPGYGGAAAGLGGGVGGLKAGQTLPPPTPSQLNNLAVAAGVGGVGEPAVKAHGGGGSVGGSSLYALYDGGGGGYGGAAGGGAAGVVGGQWRPRGVLLGHLMEHRKAVTQMAVSGRRGGGYLELAFGGGGRRECNV